MDKDSGDGQFSSISQSESVVLPWGVPITLTGVSIPTKLTIGKRGESRLKGI